MASGSPEWKLFDYIARELGYPSGSIDEQEIRERIIGYIRSGIYRINEIAGADIDYSEDLAARTLLKDYCRYENAHAGEDFETNFLAQLTSLNMKYRVKEINNEAES